MLTVECIYCIANIATWTYKENNTKKTFLKMAIWLTNNAGKTSKLHFPPKDRFGIINEGPNMSGVS